MKKLNILILSALTAVSGSWRWASVEQGKTLPTIWNWVKSSSGLYAESNWLKKYR